MLIIVYKKNCNIYNKSIILYKLKCKIIKLINIKIIYTLYLLKKYNNIMEFKI